ncbi:MAG: HAMP domain-containing histidine kinase [Myxococcales bacterium]|nr:HAMP domain-containing histidine kinase [Myxococcales bacterium]
MALAAGLLVLVAGLSAREALSTPFPSLLVDPHGDYSVVFRPHWGTEALGLELHEPIHPVDATGLRASDRAARLAEAVARTRASHLALLVGEGDAARVIEAPLRALDLADVWWFFGLYTLAGGLLLWSGVAVYAMARRRAAARAYFALSVVGFVFLVTFLDYHTTRWLAPLFAACTLGNALSIAALAWCFPSPWRTSKTLAWVLLAIGLVLCSLLAIDAFVHWDLRPLRLLTSAAVPLALLGLAAAVLWRLRSAQGVERSELVAAGVGLVVTPVVVGLGFGVMWVANASSFHLLLPIVALAIPASIGYAIIRSNVLGLEAVLSRRALVVPLGMVAIATGGSAFFVLHGADGSPFAAAVAAAAGTALFGVLGWATLTRRLFPARARFQPTIEELADHFAHETDPTAIRTRIREQVLRFLPTRNIDVVDAGALESAPGLTERTLDQLQNGEVVWTDEGPWERHLLVPMRAGGVLRGLITLAPRHDRALFTTDDIRLVQTIAGLGALAIYNAEVVRRLDAERAMERDATRDDKRLVVDALVAEVAHELAYPLSFLRHFLKQAGQGNVSDAMRDVGRDEIARLERMLASLRRLQVPSTEMRALEVRSTLERALLLLRPQLEAKALRCELEVPSGWSIMADPDPTLQLMLNLLRNAIQASDHGGQLGVRRVCTERATTLEFWDEGAGVQDEDLARIFNPWFTTRRGGTGLGLAVVQRVARSFRWRVQIGRRDGQTIFSVEIPRHEVTP